MKEIVIKIDDVDYEYIKNGCIIPIKIDNHIYDAIRNGKVLPKGHGRIGDLDEFGADFNRKCCGECGCCSYAYGYNICALFKDAEVLIEADKEVKNE